MKMITTNICQKITNPKIVVKNYFCTLFFLLLIFTKSAIAEECSSNNYSALVINSDSKAVLFEDNADKIIYPASLTKLMTIYLVFEAIKDNKIGIDQTLIASKQAEETSAINKTNTLGLKEGDKVSVKQAIEGSLVKSYNELTIMLAEAIAGDEWQFARKMNAKAKDLGMHFTNFRNASGLDNYGQYTTDEDLAKLVLALRKNFPEYDSYFSLKKFTYKKEIYKTHNEILLKYKGADGMKTGFTNKAGYNLIASASRDGKRVVSIVTGCESSGKRYELTKDLLNKAFE